MSKEITAIKEQAVSMYKSGMTLTEVSEAMGGNPVPSTVSKWAREAGVFRSSLKPMEQIMASDAYDGKVSDIQDAAESMGYSHHAAIEYSLYYYTGTAMNKSLKQIDKAYKKGADMSPDEDAVWRTAA